MPFPRMLSRRRSWFGALLALAGLVFAPAPSRAEPEDRVKATYLYNFTTLVKWPESAFAGPQAPLIVGVVGRDPFEGGLESYLRGQKAGTRALEVRHLRVGDAAALQGCHLLYVSAAERAAEVVRAVRGYPVLVVSDAEDFARKGGTIGFVVRQQKIKLEINRGVAQQARLGIPSDLLGIATIVN